MDMTDVRTTFRSHGLVRPEADRVLGGVLAGLGRRVGLDPWPARVLFVLLLLLVPGSQLVVYPVLWLLMPGEQAAERAHQPGGQVPATWPGAA